MNIGEAAALSGLPAKTIRYYEEIGLVRPALRAANGYRDYGLNDVRTLVFLQRAHSLERGLRPHPRPDPLHSPPLIPHPRRCPDSCAGTAGDAAKVTIVMH